MELAALVVCSLTTVVLVLGVGLRLLWAAARTRRVPETAIGTACVSITLGALAMLAVRRVPELAHGEAIFTAGVAVMNAGALALGVGLWRTFRPQSRVAPAVCALWAIVTIAAWGALAAAGDPVSRWGHSLESLVLSSSRLGVYAWAAVECFRYHRMLARRLTLGLADPMIAHQIQLWGVSATATVVVLAYALHANFVSHVPALATSAGLLVLTFFGSVGGVAIWLAFFPPLAYRRALAARATSLCA